MRKSRRGSRPAGFRSTSVHDRAVRVVESLESRLLFAATTPYISEFVAGNASGIADEDGAHSDWIEVYNPTSAPVSLNNWSLTDDAADKRKWIFPDVTIDAGGYLVIFADDKNRRVPTAPLHTNFKLSSAGEYLGLLKPDQTAAYDFAPSFPAQTDDISYGARFTNTTLLASGSTAQTWIPTDNSLGSSWTTASYAPDGRWISGPTGIGFGTIAPPIPGIAYYALDSNAGDSLGHVGAGSIRGGAGYNSDISTRLATGGKSLLLDGVDDSFLTPNLTSALSGSGDTFTASVWFKARAGGQGGVILDEVGDNSSGPGWHDSQIELQPGGAVVVRVWNVSSVTVGTASFGQWHHVVLRYDGSTDTLDGYVDGVKSSSVVGDRAAPFESGYQQYWGIGTADGTSLGNGRQFDGLVDDFAVWGKALTTQQVQTLYAGTSPATLSDGTGNLIRTNVQSSMKNVNATAYVRVPFTVANPSAYESLSLQMQYDDGFVAYLNGVEIARRNAPAATTYNSAATADRPSGSALTAENINVSAFRSALVAGNNVLAIQGLNFGASDAEFLVSPQLIGVSSNPADLRSMTVPTPGGPNSNSFADLAAPVTFSVPHGIYSSAFQLTLADATPGVTIRYTLDGSDPTATTGTVYSGPLTINHTSIIRAAAFRTGFTSAASTTQSYFFLSDVKTQSPNGELPGPGWAGSGVNGQELNYGMDPDIVNNLTWGPQLNAALTQIPTLSITTALPNLFDSATGIYVNPGQDGRDWERPASVELIDPSGAQQGFSIDAGLRIRGGFSRTPGNPKHSFRLFFRDDYGGTLDYPLFGSEGVGKFHSIDLRTAQNYSWSFLGDPSMNFIAEVFTRDTERAMGDPYTRTRTYQLYIDGQYWGLYQTEERPEADFASSYFGGDDTDYDVMKVEAGPYTVSPTDGNADAWNALWNLAIQGFGSTAAYNNVLGKDPVGNDDPTRPVYIDVKNIQDYMLDTYWTGNLDAPISAFLGNAATNNFYGLRNRNVSARQGWQFFQHDGEHTLLDVNTNRLGPFSAGDQVQYFNPQWLHQQLMANPTYRQQFIDRVQATLFGNGALSVPNALARFQQRASEIDQAIIAESARWGDSKVSTPFTKDNWSAAIADKLTNFIPNRTPVLISQLRGIGWFPSVDAPLYKVNNNTSWGATLGSGDQLTITATGGTIYYTTNGSDPRMPDGSLNPLALTIPSGGQVTLTHTATVKVRLRSPGAEWSALNEAVFVKDPAAVASSLAITEVNYNPQNADATLGETAADNSDYEFIELLNKTSGQISLKGVHFTAGINFTFADDAVLAPGQRAVIVHNLAAFKARYGAGAVVLGTYADNLDGSGEQVTLLDAAGGTVTSFTYDDASPWPTRADGKGSTLELINPAGSYTDPANWRASSEFGGTPGTSGTGPLAGIVVNEVMTNGAGAQKDSIELFNPTGASVNIGGWYLTDSSDAYRKFKVPVNTTLAAGAYALYDESSFNPGNGVNMTDFALGSAGDDVYLLSADATTGRFTRFIDDVHFIAAEQGASFGRYPNGSGELYPMATYTPAAANSTPRIGSVILNEVMYNPASGGAEFIELRNFTAASVPLYDPAIPANTWKFTSGINFTFPGSATIPASSYALVVGIDPNIFRSQYNVPAGVPIYGPFTGDDLANAGDNIVLSRPATPTGTSIPYIQVDRLPYGVTSPWSATPNGGGPSLARVGAPSPTPDASNWAAEVNGGSPGQSNFTVAGAATVKGRFLFYNNSKFDGFDAGPGAADDTAIATDKSPLLPGATSASGKFVNYSSYSLGLNGVMIDIAGLPTGMLSAAGDFTFRVGNNSTPSGWATPTVSPIITVRPGAGTAGSDRIELIWPDSSIKNQWLQITVLANVRTGLTTPDVFYFGNAVGETGRDPANANVDSADYYGIRDHLRSFDNPVPLTWAWDLNRDGITDITDVMLVRASAVTGSAALQLITLQPAPVQSPVVKTATTVTAAPLVFRPGSKPPIVSSPTPSNRQVFGVRTLIPVMKQLKSGWTVAKP